MDTKQPSPSGNNGTGRAANGTFGKGNKFGKGNPLAKRVGKLRAALVNAVSPGDMKAIVASLVAAAKSGDVAAAKLLFERVCGPVKSLDTAAELDELRAHLAELDH